MAFADDLVLAAESTEKLQASVNIWTKELEERGLKINITKTKTMIIARQQQAHRITIYDEQVEQVQRFKYLGVIISADGKFGEEIEARISATSKLLYSINRQFISKSEVSEKTKKTVFKTVYVPTLIYGCESWALTAKQQSRLQATEMRYLRRTIGKTRRDRIRNTVVRQRLNIDPVMRTIENSQLRWFGHAQRMGAERLPRRTLEARCEGKRPRGRRRKTWMDSITSILSQRGISTQQAKAIEASGNLFGHPQHRKVEEGSTK